MELHGDVRSIPCRYAAGPRRAVARKRAMRVLPCHGHRNARVHRLRRRGERCRQRRAMKGWGNAMLWVTRHTIPDQSQRDRVADPALHRSCGDVSLRPGGGGPGAVPPRQGTSSSPPRISELDGRHAGPPPRSPSLRSSPADRRPARPGSRHRARCARARPRPRRRRRPPHRARAARRRDRRARGPRLWPPSPSRRPRSPRSAHGGPPSRSPSSSPG